MAGIDDIERLVDRLEAAIRKGDFAEAQRLSVVLQQRLATAQRERPALERRAEALLAQLHRDLEAQFEAARVRPIVIDPGTVMIGAEEEEEEEEADEGTYLEEPAPGPAPKKPRGGKKKAKAAKKSPKKKAAKAARPAKTPVKKKPVKKKSRKKKSGDEFTRRLFRMAKIVNESDDDVDESAADQGFMYPVWFGTNRQPSPGRKAGFSGKRHDQTAYGRIDVWVPKAHRFGETGSGFFKRIVRLDLRDDRLRVEKIEPMAAPAFWGSLRDEMAAARKIGDPAHALVFLHGYNNSFEVAAIRAAQLGVDLEVTGATAMFSWPSRGSLWGYVKDAASIEASEGAIAQFLIDFSAQSGAEKIHLIAHSMGNRGLLRAMQRIAGNVAANTAVKFGQIILAAPDVGRDLFLQLAHLYPARGERTTLYASKRDLAVHASVWKNGAPRAGYFLPYTVATEIDTIAVPNFDVDLLGHSYFAEAEALLYDIIALIRSGKGPDERPRLRRLRAKGTELWEFGR